MCEKSLSAGMYVVPNLPAAEMGWWVGRVIKIQNSNIWVSCLVEVLCSENKQSGEGPIVALQSHLVFFENLTDALNHLKKNGILLNMPLFKDVAN